MIKHKNLIIKIAIIILGIIGGYAYWYYVGCTSGSCPIYSKWHLSSIYGGLVGFVIAGFVVKDKPKNQE